MKLPVAFFVCLSVAAPACKPSGTEPAPTSSRFATGKVPCKEDKNKSCEKDSSSADAQGDHDQGDEGSLPEYLFSLKQVRAVDEIVEKYRKPEGTDPRETESSSEYSSLRSFIQDLLGRGMSISSLKPGRDVDVQVIDNEDYNATMDGFKVMRIHTAYIKNTTQLAFMATLCHELAHSTRNHMPKRLDFFTTGAKARRIDDAYVQADKYLKDAYNDRKGAYTHDLTGYRKVRKVWDAVAPDIGILFKQQESEADIVGSMICAHLGMKPEDFHLGYKEEAEIIERMYAESGGGGSGPDDLDDGETFEVPAEHLFNYLFPLDTHPTDPERIRQLERVRSALADHLEEKQRFYDEWLDRSEGLRGMGLTSFRPDYSYLARHHFVSAVTSKGRKIRIEKPRH